MSNEKIIGIHGAAQQTNTPDPEVISELKILLELAQNGQILGFSYAAARPSSIETGWAGTADCHDMCCVANMLAFRVTQAVIE